MSAKILSGTVVRDAKEIELTKKFKFISPTPELAIIQVGNRPDSTAYIAGKMAFAKKVGVTTHHIHLSDTTSQNDLIKEIERCNSNQSIKGIIVQLPLPTGINRDLVINTIDPRKDIDGLTATNIELLNLGRSNAVVPATARGIIELLHYYNIQTKDKKITVVGRSQLVGRPIAQLLSSEGAIVTVAHSKTIDLAQETKSADIIITAVGKPDLIKAGYVKSGQIIVDVGRDVDFTAVKEVLGENGAITPVPGGVGPMTVFALFENLFDMCA